MFVWVIKMLQYNRIDVSELIDTNKTSASKECDICHYWYFKNIGFKYEPYVCNGCHYISMIAYELKNITIVTVKGVLWNMSKNDASDRLDHFKPDVRGTLWI